MRRAIYTPHRCRNKKCWTRLSPSNAATNFSNPALGVRIAVKREIIKEEQKVLEFGGGNLRNSLFILKSLPGIRVFAYDINDTIERFRNKYEEFRKLGGSVVGADYRKRKYHAILCTFVLETICPERNRMLALRSLRSSLTRRGVLVASFRGYQGVRGSRYEKCPLGEGLVTPLNTFVKPYSIPEVQNLLLLCGFRFFYPLQKYRVDKPQNIHIIALSEVKDGEKVVREVLF